MGRLALGLGEAGEIKVRKHDGYHVARCHYRRHDGTYVDIRRRRRTADRARQAVRDAIKRITRTRPGADLTLDTRFEVAARRWLEEYRKDAEAGVYSLTTVDTYSDHLRNHVLPVLGSLAIRDVTTPVINKLCQSNLRKHSLSLARHTKTIAMNVMTFLVQEGVLEANPAKEIAPLIEKRAKTKRKVPSALTSGQVLDLLSRLDADEEAAIRDLPDLVRFFIATGERVGEALGAHWADFDSGAKALRMEGNIIQARGVGAVRNEGKSETAQRTIPLPDWCVWMLQERREKLGVIDPDTPIFTNTRGGYVNASNLNNRYWIPFRKRAGYPELTWHTLRKTVATLLDQAGLSARQIADILGHAHPSMTQNVYMGRNQVDRSGAQALELVVSG
nr:site-specific integrase [Kibdelosporangium sp. MJ126-NF4]CEL16266.1 Phage integrase [Kibdelosporangium sp. MJ126-NF4]CTQ94190.1 Phage integrase [Kibdelosporangium sp. MJ126-NF4]